MLDADIDSLLDVPVADSLVDYDTHCGLGDIIDDAGFAVVDFMGHAMATIRKFVLVLQGRKVYRPFLDGSVCFDINNVPDSKHPLTHLLQM